MKAKVTWTLGFLVWALAYLGEQMLWASNPYTDSPRLEIGLLLLAFVPAILAMYALYRIFDRGKQRRATRLRHPSYLP